MIVRLLILGDTHIPARADDLPSWVKEIVEEGWDVILHTGDVEEGWVLEYLSHFGEVHVVRGNMDHLRLPKFEVLDLVIGRVLLVHGHQAHPRGNVDQLLSLARSAGANILVSGHTHRYVLERYEGVLLINPGTATGAWGGSYEGGEESVVTYDGRGFYVWKNGRIVLSLKVPS